MRKRFKKFKPRVIHYRSSKHFSNILENVRQKSSQRRYNRTLYVKQRNYCVRTLYVKQRNYCVRTVYVKQRNYCVLLLRKTKEMYCSNVGEKNVTDNERFWKTVKPLLSDKPTHQEKLNLSENGEIIKADTETANFLNNFSSKFVQNLNISRFTDSDPLIQNIKYPTLKAILKYRKHPRKTAIESRYRDVSSFSFVEVNQGDIEKKCLI